MSAIQSIKQKYLVEKRVDPQTQRRSSGNMQAQINRINSTRRNVSEQNYSVAELKRLEAEVLTLLHTVQKRILNV